MLDLIVSVPDHCLSFYLENENCAVRFSNDVSHTIYSFSFLYRRYVTAKRDVEEVKKKWQNVKQRCR